LIKTRWGEKFTLSDEGVVVIPISHPFIADSEMSRLFYALNF